MSTPTVLITGSTGLLGRAIVSAFQRRASPVWNVVGSSFSRGGPSVVKCDLRKAADIRDMVASVAPRLVIHAAAERRPDVCEKDEESSEQLNVVAVWELSRAAAAAGADFVYISSDYLFDGEHPPYAETAAPAPLNAYGRQKLRGEYAALAGHPRAVSLRVPVLYGPTADIGESAVTVFARTVVERSAGRKVLDDWQIRVPTFTLDIGETLANIGAALVGNSLPGGIYHYSAPSEGLTRFTIARRIAGLMGLPCDHVDGDARPPAGAPRPRDAALSCEKLAVAGLAAPATPFDVGMKAVLDSFVIDPAAHSITPKPKPAADA